jgi:hypothetical protein
MNRPGTLRRLVGVAVAAALVLSLAAPARAQFDPLTLSLMMGGIQLLTGAIGVATTMGIGAGSENKPGISMPYGTPCGVVDGVPQICWQPHAGGFEGSPDLPTGAAPAPGPALHPAESPGPSLDPNQAQGQ